MKKYEYKFVGIQRRSGLKVKSRETFEECKQIIKAEAEQGWRLKHGLTQQQLTDKLNLSNKTIAQPSLLSHIPHYPMQVTLYFT